MQIAVFVSHVYLSVQSLVAVCCAQDVGGVTGADLPPPGSATQTHPQEPFSEWREGTLQMVLCCACTIRDSISRVMRGLPEQFLPNPSQRNL